MGRHHRTLVMKRSWGPNKADRPSTVVSTQLSAGSPEAGKASAPRAKRRMTPTPCGSDRAQDKRSEGDGAFLRRGTLGPHRHTFVMKRSWGPNKADRPSTVVSTQLSAGSPEAGKASAPRAKRRTTEFTRCALTGPARRAQTKQSVGDGAFPRRGTLGRHHRTFVVKRSWGPNKADQPSFAVSEELSAGSPGAGKASAPRAERR